MKRLLISLALLLASPALAQTTPNWVLGYKPAPSEWNSLWGGKQDYNGNVTGSSVTPNGGSGASGTLGSLMQWATPYHESQGGLSTGHVLGWMDQNQLLTADYFKISSGDQSLYTRLAVTGTPTTAESVGFNWTVSGTPYQVRYTVQVGDTNQSIALGICNAIAANSSLTAALKAFHGVDGVGYMPVQTGCVNQTSGGVIYFDSPWGSSNSTVAASSAHSTVTITDGKNIGSAPRLDGGPFLVLHRYVSGYQPASGDQSGIIYFEGQTGPTSNYAQTGAIGVTYAGNGTSTFNTQMFFNAADNAGSSQNVFAISKGAYVFNDGAACLGDPGFGGFSACNVYANNFFLGSDVGQTIGKDGSGNTQVLAQSGKNLVLGTYTGSPNISINASMVGVTGLVAGVDSTYALQFTGGSGYTSISSASGATGIILNPDADGTQAVMRISRAGASQVTIESLDHTGTSAYENLALSGVSVFLQASGTTAATANSSGLYSAGAVGTKAPSTVTGSTYTVASSDAALILNPSGAQTLTLPSAATYSGRILSLKLISAFAVTSASSNVVPLAGGAASTAILTGTAGKWAALQSDGTNWQIMAAN